MGGLWGAVGEDQLGWSWGGPSYCQEQGEAGPLCMLDLASYPGVSWGPSDPGLGESSCLLSHGFPLPEFLSAQGECGRVPKRP